jgi:2,3-bisphosphoglycerate-dependent phosphoglycerate mutase
MDSDKTVIYLVRHGEIDANVARRWFGSTDSELNANGIAQADRLGDYVKQQYPQISKIYSSPLKRTMRTAQGLAGAHLAVAEPHPGLREYAIGELEGCAFEELATEHRFFDKLAQSADYAPPGGESVNQVRDRMITTLFELHDRHPGEHIAVVSHGAAMAIALTQLLQGTAYPFNEFHMANTGISKLILQPTPALLFFNHTGHLDDTAESAGQPLGETL